MDALYLKDFYQKEFQPRIFKFEGNLVILTDIGINHPVVVSILGSSEKGRFTDAEKLITAVIKTISSE